MQGLAVFLDANIPTNLGAGTNEDRIIVARFDDDLLFESDAPTVGLYNGVLSANLQVRIMVWGVLRLHLRPASEGEFDHRRHRIDCTDLLGGGRDSGWVGCRKGAPPGHNGRASSVPFRSARGRAPPAR